MESEIKDSTVAGCASFDFSIGQQQQQNFIIPPPPPPPIITAVHNTGPSFYNNNSNTLLGRDYNIPMPPHTSHNNNNNMSVKERKMRDQEIRKRVVAATNEPRYEEPIFGVPVKIAPCDNDHSRKLIKEVLGDYDQFKPVLDKILHLPGNGVGGCVTDPSNLRKFGGNNHEKPFVRHKPTAVATTPGSDKHKRSTSAIMGNRVFQKPDEDLSKKSSDDNSTSTTKLKFDQGVKLNGFVRQPMPPISNTPKTSSSSEVGRETETIKQMNGVNDTELLPKSKVPPHHITMMTHQSKKNHHLKNRVLVSSTTTTSNLTNIHRTAPTSTPASLTTLVPASYGTTDKEERGDTAATADSNHAAVAAVDVTCKSFSSSSLHSSTSSLSTTTTPHHLKNLDYLNNLNPSTILEVCFAIPSLITPISSPPLTIKREYQTTGEEPKAFAQERKPAFVKPNSEKTTNVIISSINTSHSSSTIPRSSSSSLSNTKVLINLQHGNDVIPSSTDPDGYNRGSAVTTIANNNFLFNEDLFDNEINNIDQNSFKPKCDIALTTTCSDKTKVDKNNNNLIAEETSSSSNLHAKDVRPVTTKLTLVSIGKNDNELSLNGEDPSSKKGNKNEQQLGSSNNSTTSLITHTTVNYHNSHHHPNDNDDWSLSSFLSRETGVNIMNPHLHHDTPSSSTNITGGEISRANSSGDTHPPPSTGERGVDVNEGVGDGGKHKSSHVNSLPDGKVSSGGHQPYHDDEESSSQGRQGYEKSKKILRTSTTIDNILPGSSSSSSSASQSPKEFVVTNKNYRLLARKKTPPLTAPPNTTIIASFTDNNNLNVPVRPSLTDSLAAAPEAALSSSTTKTCSSTTTTTTTSRSFNPQISTTNTFSNKIEPINHNHDVIDRKKLVKTAASSLISTSNISRKSESIFHDTFSCVSASSKKHTLSISDISSPLTTVVQDSSPNPPPPNKKLKKEFVDPTTLDETKSTYDTVVSAISKSRSKNHHHPSNNDVIEGDLIVTTNKAVGIGLGLLPSSVIKPEKDHHSGSTTLKKRAVKRQQIKMPALLMVSLDLSLVKKIPILPFQHNGCCSDVANLTFNHHLTLVSEINQSQQQQNGGSGSAQLCNNLSNHQQQQQQSLNLHHQGRHNFTTLPPTPQNNLWLTSSNHNNNSTPPQRNMVSVNHMTASVGSVNYLGESPLAHVNRGRRDGSNQTEPHNTNNNNFNAILSSNMLKVLTSTPNEYFLKWGSTPAPLPLPIDIPLSSSPPSTITNSRQHQTTTTDMIETTTASMSSPTEPGTEFSTLLASSSLTKDQINALKRESWCALGLDCEKLPLVSSQQLHRIAKGLKRLADRQVDKELKKATYLDAIIYFVLYGDHIETVITTTPNSSTAASMPPSPAVTEDAAGPQPPNSEKVHAYASVVYNDTLKLCNHILDRIQKTFSHERYNQYLTHLLEHHHYHHLHPHGPPCPNSLSNNNNNNVCLIEDTALGSKFFNNFNLAILIYKLQSHLHFKLWKTKRWASNVGANLIPKLPNLFTHGQDHHYCQSTQSNVFLPFRYSDMPKLTVSGEINNLTCYGDATTGVVMSRNNHYSGPPPNAIKNEYNSSGGGNNGALLLNNAKQHPELLARPPSITTNINSNIEPREGNSPSPVIITGDNLFASLSAKPEVHGPLSKQINALHNLDLAHELWDSSENMIKHYRSLCLAYNSYFSATNGCHRCLNTTARNNAQISALLDFEMVSCFDMVNLAFGVPLTVNGPVWHLVLYVKYCLHSLSGFNYNLLATPSPTRTIPHPFQQQHSNQCSPSFGSTATSSFNNISMKFNPYSIDLPPSEHHHHHVKVQAGTLGDGNVTTHHHPLTTNRVNHFVGQQQQLQQHNKYDTSSTHFVNPQGPEDKRGDPAISYANYLRPTTKDVCN